MQPVHHPEKAGAGAGPKWRAAMGVALVRAENLLARRTVGWMLLVLLAGLYTVAYLRHPLYPRAMPVEARQGWWSWADQYVYWQSAAELARGQLTGEHYFYPLGYPALAVPLLPMLQGNAFFVVDLLLVLGAAMVWWRLARGWFSRVQALVVGMFFLAGHAELLALTQVIPWNTIATQLTLLAGLWVMVATAGRRTVWMLAGLAALTYLVRPGDGACFAPMLIWAVLRLPAWREKLRCAAGGMAMIGAVVLGVGLVNRAVFGTWDTPYEHATLAGIGFFSYPALDKLFWIFVDGGPFFGETDTALLFRHPWLFLAVPGTVFWIRTAGMAAVAALATLALNWLLYLNYNDFFPSAVYRFSLIHYLSWGFAPLFALAAAAVLKGWRDRATRIGFAGALALFVLALGLHLDERSLPVAASPGRVDRLPAVRPLQVSFPGVPLENHGQLRLDGRRLQEAADFQMPYVPADLRLLLSARAQGAVLVARPETGITATPVVSVFVWGWRLELRRLRGVGF